MKQSRKYASAGPIPRYVVVGSKPWNRTVFRDQVADLPGRWHFISRRDRLTATALRKIRPRYVFFLHWSWMVPSDIIEEFECVCFHLTDVPYGRGGSPLQNLILRGHRRTRLTALRMTEKLDAGPVYSKRTLSLHGTAQEILVRSSKLAALMIESIIDLNPTPQAQHGPVTVFKRRRPDESAIPPTATVEQLHDFIRMLDAEGYPHARIDHGGFRYEFTDARRLKDRLTACVKITVLPATTA